MFWFFLQFFTENCCFEFCIIFSGCRIDTSKCNIQIGVGEMLLRNKNSQQEMLENLIKIWIEFTSWHFLCMRGNKLDCMWKNYCIFCLENLINLIFFFLNIYVWHLFILCNLYSQRLCFCLHLKKKKQVSGCFAPATCQIWISKLYNFRETVTNFIFMQLFYKNR